ncbi:proteasome subunit alpha type-1-like [Drosophila obscura]|uniref:proteasome subunit alpha type-1-like n=1 Tax=Drosophila obscura TaxID=7282 RepID=UPI001BB1C432|nr:proteasome subunit alpha type-1-like [Drosophila obscura]
MFRNQYDSEVSVWSPQGRLHQVEYAMEAVKQGTATVGLKGRDAVVLVALGKSSELSVALRKIIPIDEHLGISIAGITADARVLSRYLHSSCLSYRYAYDATHPVERLMTNLGNKMQCTTQRYDRRPYGVGLLVAGYDEKGPNLYQVMPSAVIYNCKAQSIGSRSQGARTYLERNLNGFLTCSNDELICHGILAIKNSQPIDGTSSGKEKAPVPFTVTVAIVAKDQPFKMLTAEEVEKYTNMANEMGAAAQPQPPINPDDDDDNGDDRPPVALIEPEAGAAADPQPDVAVMEH